MASLRSSIKIDVRVDNATRLSAVTKELEKAGQNAAKAAQQELRLHQAVGKVAQSELQRQQQAERGQYRLQQATHKIAQQQEAAEAKRAAAAVKQTAREDTLRARAEAAEARRIAKQDALTQRTLAREQAARTKQVQLIERNAERAATAAERQAAREKRAIVTVETEMARLQKLQDRRKMTAEARDRLGLPPVGTGGSFMAGHGFLNRGRQALGVARDLTVAGYGIYGAARAGVGLAEGVFDPFREFQSSMVAARSKGQWTAKETADVAALVRQMGRTTTFSATQSGGAAVELSAAGVKASGMKSALPTTLQFAQASGLGTEQSAGLLVETMSQFGLGVGDFEHIGDVMVRAANESTISVSDLGESLNKVGPLAKAAGMSLSDVAGTIAFLGERGIKASEAGTGLRTVIASLTKPTKQSKDALATLGLSKKQLQEGLNDLPKFMAQLEERMTKKKLSAPQRLGILTSIFGREGMTLAQALLSGDAWKKYREEMARASGDMASNAAAAADTFDGKMARLNATVEESKIALAEKFAPALQEKVIPALTQAALKTGDWVTKHAELTKGLAAAGGLAMGAWAVSKIPGVATAGSWLASGVTTALGSSTLTAAVTTSGASLAGTLMLAVASGIAGYSLTSAVMKSLAEVDTDNQLAEKITDILFGARTDRAGGRGVGATKTVAQAIAEQKATEGDAPMTPLGGGPLSPQQLDQIEANKRAGIVDVNGSIVIDLRYGKPPRIEEIRSSGVPLRLGVNAAH